MRRELRVPPPGTLASLPETLTDEDAPGDASVTGYRILRRRPSQGEDTLLVYVADTGSTATTFVDTSVTAPSALR